VIGIDVGYGQLAERLRRDARVRLLERTNVRQVDLEIIGGRPVDILVADLSFISLTKVLPVLLPLVKPTGSAIVLIKPQFEVERADIGKGGIVRRPEVWEAALTRVGSALEVEGWELRGLTVSPIQGAAGNVEFLALVERAAPSSGPITPLAARIAEVLPQALALLGLEPEAPSGPPSGLTPDGTDESEASEEVER
jgi:23S rRNA (cytidine1920-2'-O)/16S rRNA (cytidine1409-2'-O)-methyltransferase